MSRHGPLVFAFILSAACFGRSTIDPQPLLEEADRLAWLSDWYSALPLYAEAEEAAKRRGDARNGLYAKFGRLRGQMQTLSLTDLSEELARDLDTPLAKEDPHLRLRGLTVKGDVDLEWDVRGAQEAWEEVLALAKQLGDQGWENRAVGELGLVAFLNGNTSEATTRVGQALSTAETLGDIGGQIRYMGSIANGLLLAGYLQPASSFVEKGLALAAEHPETGFPYVLYSTKVLTLLELDQPDEAERFAKAAIAEAEAGDRRIKEIELRLMLSEVARKRNQLEHAIAHLEQAVDTARSGQVRRLLGNGAAALADAYRAAGDLDKAQHSARLAVEETQAAGSRFTLPARLQVLADIKVAQGDFREADQIYEQATDIVEGVMVNVPSPVAQARLIGVMSDLYTNHFLLAAERLQDPVRAYHILERARGRAAADVLHAFVGGEGGPTPESADHSRAISQLQVDLMRARTPTERQQLLDQLWEIEHRPPPHLERPGMRIVAGRDPVEIAALQENLLPDEVVIEYVLGEPRSYGLAISREVVELIALPSRASIDPLVDGFVSEIQDTKAAPAAAAQGLHDAIVRPVLHRIGGQRLVVVPDGPLHVLPFDTLLALSKSDARTATVAPSAGVLFLLRTTSPRGAPSRPLLAVGGVPYERMFTGASPDAAEHESDGRRGLYDLALAPALPPLESSRDEVRTAARLLGPDSVVLTDEEASESAFKAQPLDDFEVLHLAVHAYADPKFPERAALVLLSDPEAGEDGLLQPREIAAFALNASVVVLSACDTAVGPTLGQEGVLNLARAFLLAGARSVVTTLWAVDDLASMSLMERFYENLTAGQDIAEALTGAKERVIERHGRSTLATVAAFQVVGAGNNRIVAPRRGAPSGEPTPPAAADARDD